MKILVFSFSFIGDAVLSTAVIHPLRQHFRDAHITFLVGPGAVSLLTPDPNVDATCVYDNRGEHAGWKGRLLLINTLRAADFDIVVNLRDSLVARWIGASHWGLRRGKRDTHAVARYLATLEHRGVDITDASPRLQPTGPECREADRFLGAAGFTPERPLIGVHPGGNWAYKLWDPKNYAAVASRLAAAVDAQILLFAGPQERARQAKVAALMSVPAIVVETADLRHLAALISLCNLYIGNDTGPMHIAAAVDTPVVALFGSTDASRSGPYGAGHRVVESGLQLGCNPCHPGRAPGGCGAGSCAVLAGIDVESVVDAAVSRLHETRRQ